MWLFSILFAFAPTSSMDPLGPPAPHLEFHANKQIALNLNQDTQNFRETFGDWRIRWDERNHTPRSLMGPGIPVERADAFAKAIGNLSGILPRALVRTHFEQRGSEGVIHYELEWEGARMEHAYIDLFIEGQTIPFALVSLVRPKLKRSPKAGEVILPQFDGRQFTTTLVQKFREGPRVVYRDDTGAIIHQYEDRYPLTVQFQERTVGDPMASAPAREVLVSNGDGSEYTDEDGMHTLTSPYNALLDGPHLTILQDGESIFVEDVLDDTLIGGTDISQSAATVLNFFNVSRDWLAARRFGHPWHDAHVIANVDNSTSSCNAIYGNGAIDFYLGSGFCPNFGEIADVSYHEFGHGIHHYGLLGGGYAADVAEGSADFMAATLTNDSCIAPGAGSAGTNQCLRDIESDRFYPDDLNGGAHNDGLIWGSLLWNLREDHIATDGFDAGVEWTDKLMLKTLQYGPSYSDLADAMIAANDDDDRLSNGTPQACEILELLDYHGLGTGDMGYVVLDHTPMEDQGSQKKRYDLDWKLINVTPDCGGFDESSPTLHYVLNPDPDTSPDELEFIEVVGDQVGQRYTVSLERLPAGTHVAYYISFSTLDKTQTITSTSDALDGLWHFWIGTTEPLWCADFESEWADWTHDVGHPYEAWPETGTSQWERGPILEDLSYAPESATSGTEIVGTSLALPGYYNSSTSQYLQSPDLSLEGAFPELILLHFQRALSVESQPQDYAEVLLTQGEQHEVLWENSDAAPHVDEEWTTVTFDLSPYEDTNEPIRISWTLSANQNIEYGGWYLDDVCVSTLADVPGHYRTSDLHFVEEDGSDQIVLEWTQPWIAPLDSTILIRNDDHIPASAQDGTIIEQDHAPQPGEAKVVADTLADPYVSHYYAVFAGSDRDGIFETIVEEENTAYWEGATPPSSCQCRSAPTTWPLWHTLFLTMLALYGTRRRNSRYILGE